MPPSPSSTFATAAAAPPPAAAPSAQSYASDEARLVAVRGRDASADGRFVYSVATTGVYCRPSCAARPARRENIAFHADGAAARAAGFRPCKRCRPDEPPLAARHAAAVAAACRAIDAAEETPPLADLAAMAGMSPYHFHRVFKAATGVTPKAYASARRAARLRVGLEGGERVTDAIFDAGYGSSSRFYEHAGERLGMTPAAFRDGGRNVELRFAVGRCSLGAVIVAASDRGIAAIELGDDPQRLVEGLQDRFPKARLIGGDAGFEELVARVVGFVEAPTSGLDLPLDVRGTAFQERVWRALRAIPAGTTATYTDVAATIGMPKAVRAVAQACAANPAAVAIPCHRVVRTDGSLSGYRWGIERKRALLEREGGKMTLLTAHQPAVRPALADRSDGLDWAAIAAGLDAHGAATTGPLLMPDECAALSALYDDESRFRSKVVMARHGFGSGEYQYFADPLPVAVAMLRERLYARLVATANGWNERLGSPVRYPDDHEGFVARCHAAGQTRPTPLLLRYGAGDFNCLHQDLYGEHVFPLQVAFLLSEPGRDFTGGEFVLTEQRPRQQSRAEVVPLGHGEGVVFAVSHRPATGARGDHRVTLRHGVSRIRSGRRHTLGIIFHDAA